jgi:hypothetical protein
MTITIQEGFGYYAVSEKENFDVGSNRCLGWHGWLRRRG